MLGRLQIAVSGAARNTRLIATDRLAKLRLAAGRNRRSLTTAAVAVATSAMSSVASAQGTPGAGIVWEDFGSEFGPVSIVKGLFVKFGGGMFGALALISLAGTIAYFIWAIFAAMRGKRA